MNASLVKNRPVVLFLLCNSLLTAAVLIILYHAPYTGIRLTGDGQRGQVLSVDNPSPAWNNGVRAGDIITGCNGKSLPATVFFNFPDYPESRQDTKAYWQGRKELAGLAANGTLTLQLEREGKPYTARITMGQFPLWRIATLIFSFLTVAWAFQILSLLVVQKKGSEAARLNFIASSLLCMMLIIDALFAPSELVFPWLPYRWLFTFNYISALLFPFITLHMMLVFPDRLNLVNRYRLIIPGIYLLASGIILVEVAGIFDNTLLTASYPQVACLLVAFTLVGIRYFKEHNMLRRKQLQWAFIGYTAGLGWGIILFTPYVQTLSGLFIYDELTILPVMITPVCLTIAIVRYRFMGITRLIDTTVAFLATILLISIIEFLFIWGVFANHLSPETDYSHSIAIVKTLLIVLFFIPIRNFVRKVLDRLFKRGNYDSAEELKNFMVRLSVQNDKKAIEKFSEFAEDLLGTSGICVAKNLPPTQILFADTEEARHTGVLICSMGDEFWHSLGARSRSFYGYQLIDDRIDSPEGADLHSFTEDFLYVPIKVDSTLRYCAVLLGKLNGTLYSAKDLELFDGLSMSLGRVLEAEEMRLAHEATEAEFHRQKEGVIQEIHDVLGNIITSIAVTAQAAGRFHSDTDRVLELLDKIGTFSNQATDFLRTGLTVLDNLDAGFGEMFHAMKRRFSDLLETVEISLAMEISPEAHRVKLAPEVTIHLLRCMQEAVNNIIKHSRAQNVTITLAMDGANLTAAISDDGQGLPDAQSPGYGLRNIAARVEAFKGTMNFGTLMPSGTVISITIPTAHIDDTAEYPLLVPNTPYRG